MEDKKEKKNLRSLPVDGIKTRGTRRQTEDRGEGAEVVKLRFCPSVDGNCFCRVANVADRFSRLCIFHAVIRPREGLRLFWPCDSNLAHRNHVPPFRCYEKLNNLCVFVFRAFRPRYPRRTDREELFYSGRWNARCAHTGLVWKKGETGWRNSRMHICIVGWATKFNGVTAIGIKLFGKSLWFVLGWGSDDGLIVKGWLAEYWWIVTVVLVTWYTWLDTLKGHSVAGR